MLGIDGLANESVRSKLRDNGWILVNNCKDYATIIADNVPNESLLESFRQKLEKQIYVKILQTDQLLEWAELIYGNNVSSGLNAHIGEPNNYIEAIIAEAVKQRASDFYIELTEKTCRTFFRINGKITNKENHSVEFGNTLFSIIKNIAQISLDETDKPQEGRFSCTIDNTKVNCRLSSVSSENSQNIVIRLLPNEFKFSIDSIGMPANILADIKQLAKSEIGGMMLFAGPTGSGKTTTLYSLIKYLNSINKKILTLEDPVEADIDGVIQIEICEQTGLSFEYGLKSILRQDPNVIMIGEIRDKKTAEIAINAASCGHLVLATIHATSPQNVLIRCKELGINEISANTTLLCILTQSLTPVKCSCTTTTNCSICNNTGYAKRIPKFSLQAKL